MNQQDTVATQSHLQCPVLNRLPGARFVLQPIANQGADVIQHDQFGIWLQGLLNEPLPIGLAQAGNPFLLFITGQQVEIIWYMFMDLEEQSNALLQQVQW